MYVTALLYSNIYFMVLRFTPSSFRAKIYYSSARNYFFLHNFVHCLLLKLGVLVCYYKHNYGQMVQNRPHCMVRHPKQKQVQFDWLRSVFLGCCTLLPSCKGILRITLCFGKQKSETVSVILYSLSHQLLTVINYDVQRTF